jgi:hypothetical protein
MTGADRAPQLRAMELEAELRNQGVEVWWLRGLVVLLLALWVVNA